MAINMVSVNGDCSVKIHMQRVADRILSIMNSSALTTSKDVIRGENKPCEVKFAEAGFYRTSKNFTYIDPEDLLRCFYCQLEKGNWSKDDDPREIHLRMNPNCQFEKYSIPLQAKECEASAMECLILRDKIELMRSRCINEANEFGIHMYIASMLDSISWTYGSEVAPKYTPQFPPLILSERTIAYEDHIRMLDWALANVDVIARKFDDIMRRRIWWLVNKTFVENYKNVPSRDPDCGKDDHLFKMVSCQFRTRSFHPLSSSVGDKLSYKERWAMAGFYCGQPHSTTEECEVKCFFCGVNVLNWENEKTNPYQEHAIRSNACWHIRSKLTPPQIKSILYHYYKDMVMGSVTQDERRSIVESILELPFQDHAIVQDYIEELYGSAARPPHTTERLTSELLRTTSLHPLLERFSVSDVVDEMRKLVDIDIPLYEISHSIVLTRLMDRDGVCKRCASSKCVCQDAETEIVQDNKPHFSNRIAHPELGTYDGPKCLTGLVPDLEPSNVLDYNM